MTVIALPAARTGAARPAVAGPSLGSAREIWAERRRRMERSGRGVGPDGQHGGWQSKALHAALCGFGWGTRLAGLYGRGRRNALLPHLVEREFSFTDLPRGFDGYRILQISDPHLDCLPELAKIARRLIGGVAVDLIAVTGDIHGAPRAPVARSALPLADLVSAAEARDGTVAVLGNHDPASMAEA